MPTDKVIQNPALPPPPSSDAEVLRFLRDLVTQLDTILGERGIALNSLIDGQFNSIHDATEYSMALPSGGASNITLDEGVGAWYGSPTAAGAHQLQGCGPPDRDGRRVTFFNAGLFTGTLDFLHLSGAAVTGGAFMNAGGGLVSIGNGASVTYRWQRDSVFPAGIWRQVQ